MTAYNRRQITFTAAAIAAATALPLRAADFPEREITIVVPWAAGGALEALMRQYVRQMEQAIPGSKFIVQGMPGGSGTISVGTVLRAKPDGYTIGYAGAGVLVYQPMVMKGLSWTRPDDVQALAKLSAQPTLLVVRSDSPLKTFDDFLREVQAKPNQVRVGVPGLRTSSDLEMQQVNIAANVKLRTVPFSGGSAEAILALLGGRVEALTSYTDGVRGQVDAGAVRVLAVFQKGRYAPFPEATPVGDLPAFSATTLLPACHYMIAPKGLPRDALDRLVAASRQVIASEEFKAFAVRGGMVVDPVTSDAIQAELSHMAGTYESLIRHLNAGEPDKS